MMRYFYIFFFTMVFMMSPKQNFACEDHDVPQNVEMECTSHSEENDVHSCCDEDETQSADHHQNQNACGDSSNCCCPIMANHSCCFFYTQSIEFDFNITLHKEEISTILVFQETNGFSSIFIPPKIA